MAEKFISDESGAVTVDWVVLTAALVGLGLAVLAVLRGGVQNTTEDVNAVLTGDVLQTAFGGQDGGAIDTPFVYRPIGAEAGAFERYFTTELAPGVYATSDAEVRSSYDDQISQAQALIAGGGQNFNDAARAMDRAYGIAQAAETRGMTLNPEAVSLETVVGEYNQTFPDYAL